MPDKCKKQILLESLSKSFLVIIFTHFETPSLPMVFTLIVSLSVMIREYPNALHLFLTSKRNFSVLNESDSFANTGFSLLNPRSLVFFSFRLYLLAYRASRGSLSLNFTMDNYTSILDFLISADVIWHRLYTISVQFSSGATGIAEISSISLLPYCSSWFLLIFSSSNSS